MVVRFKVPSPPSLANPRVVVIVSNYAVSAPRPRPLPAMSRQKDGAGGGRLETGEWGPGSPDHSQPGGRQGGGEREREDTSHRTEDGCSIVPAAWLAVTGLQMSYLYMLVYTMCCVEANITIIRHHPLPRPRLFPLSAVLAHFTRSVKSPGCSFLLREPEIEKESIEWGREGK